MKNLYLLGDHSIGLGEEIMGDLCPLILEQIVFFF